jgi:Cu/Ag efflux protein CusF
MSKHLLRAAMILSITAVALTASVRAQDTNAPAAKPAKPERKQFTGVIESIDAKAETVIVKKGTTSDTFKIGEKTKYATVDKTKDAALTDIKVGDKVTVYYTLDASGVMMAHKIGPPASAKKTD